MLVCAASLWRLVAPMSAHQEGAICVYVWIMPGIIANGRCCGLVQSSIATLLLSVTPLPGVVSVVLGINFDQSTDTCWHSALVFHLNSCDKFSPRGSFVRLASNTLCCDSQATRLGLSWWWLRALVVSQATRSSPAPDRINARSRIRISL